MSQDNCEIDIRYKLITDDQQKFKNTQQSDHIEEVQSLQQLLSQSMKKPQVTRKQQIRKPKMDQPEMIKQETNNIDSCIQQQDGCDQYDNDYQDENYSALVDKNKLQEQYLKYQQESLNDLNQQEEKEKYQEFQNQLEQILQKGKQKFTLKHNKQQILWNGEALLVCPRCKKVGLSRHQHHRCSFKYACLWFGCCYCLGSIFYLFCPGCKKNHKHVHNCKYCDCEIISQNHQCGRMEDFCG